MAEQWVNIKQFPNYQVSPEGRVRVEKHKGNGRRYRELKTHNDANGNLYVWMFSNHTGHIKCYVAYMVLEAYVGPPPIDDGTKCWMAAHKNGDLENCNYFNLHWVEGNPHGPDQSAVTTKTPDRPRSLYTVELLVCQRHTGRMFLYKTLTSAAAACNMLPQELLRELGQRGPDGEFLYKLQDKAVAPPPKPKSRKDKIIAFDHVTGERIVTLDPGTMATLTGVDESAIIGSLHHRNYGLIAGYSFKWFKDPTAFPSPTRDEAMVSRVEHFIPPVTKSPQSVFKVSDLHTGRVLFFDTLDKVAEHYGWSYSGTKAWYALYPDAPYLTRWTIELVEY